MPHVCCGTTPYASRSSAQRPWDAAAVGAALGTARASLVVATELALVAKSSEVVGPAAAAIALLASPGAGAVGSSEGCAVVDDTSFSARAAASEGRAVVVIESFPARAAASEGRAVVVVDSFPARTAASEGRAVVVVDSFPARTAASEGAGNDAVPAVGGAEDDAVGRSVVAATSSRSAVAVAVVGLRVGETIVVVVAVATIVTSDEVGAAVAAAAEGGTSLPRAVGDALGRLVDHVATSDAWSSSLDDV